jgi:bifunctional DNA-binding transcriptional regulator/antitoxin component of YhaV-PrlF toxin-antitoxin module
MCLEIQRKGAPSTRFEPAITREVFAMTDQVEISVDSHGCIMIPVEVQERLGLTPGMTLIVEERETGEVCLRVQNELPELVDKKGVLVVKSEATEDLAEVVKGERNRRSSQTMRPTD